MTQRNLIIMILLVLLFIVMIGAYAIGQNNPTRESEQVTITPTPNRVEIIPPQVIVSPTPDQIIIEESPAVALPSPTIRLSPSPAITVAPTF